MAQVKLLSHILILLLMFSHVFAQPEGSVVINKLRNLVAQYNAVCPEKEVDCDGALDRCAFECNRVTFLLDNASAKFIPIIKTDFVKQCQEACLQGMRYCAYAEEEKCYEFKRACRKACPSSVYLSGSASPLTMTEAKEKCGDACMSGGLSCE